MTMIDLDALETEARRKLAMPSPPCCDFAAAGKIHREGCSGIPLLAVMKIDAIDVLELIGEIRKLKRMVVQ